MTSTADKARALRLERLRKGIAERLEQPASALETLMSELKLSELHPDLWEGMHAAAARDGQEEALAEAYRKVTTERRLKPLNPTARAELLMYAANFFQGLMGDRKTAGELLELVLTVAPDQPEAFARLEQRFASEGDPHRLLRLYALVAATPPQPAFEIADSVIKVLLKLSPREPLDEDVCRGLVPYAQHNLVIVTNLETHARRTDRPDLACEVLERAIAELVFPDSTVIDLRRRLVDAYLGGASSPGGAMPHVEAMLEFDPYDPKVRAGAEKLLGVRDVASRAAAVLKSARRPGSNRPPPK